MKIKQTCTRCGGCGTEDTEVKEGDILTPRDGSGMPKGLHRVLWNGMGAGVPFKPIRIIQVEDAALAVVPLHWDDADTRHKEKLNDEVNPAISWLPESEVFWIYAPYCNLIAFTKEAK